MVRKTPQRNAAFDPTPLVPQTVGGWLSPLARSLLAAAALFCGLAWWLSDRQGQALTDAALRS